MKKILFLAIIGLFISCENQTKPEAAELTENDSTQLLMKDKGLKLLEQNCYSCHSPQGDHDSRLAPPLIAIKRHYIDDETSLEQFTSDLIHFIDSPSTDKSKMPGAIRKFGLMPKMQFSEEDLSLIATYIFEEDIESPEWFEQHQKEMHGKGKKASSTAESDIEKGKKMALKAKSILGKNLMAAIQNKGTVGALEFCNLSAIPLTDSASKLQNAHIKRVSDKARNPSNKANENELAYINEAKELLMKGEDAHAYFEEENGLKRGFYPIITNAMCLQCHGQPETDIETSTLAAIDRLYPKDQAKGYGLNELRGLFVVEWKED